jgi:hypothetical protein
MISFAFGEEVIYFETMSFLIAVGDQKRHRFKIFILGGTAAYWMVSNTTKLTGCAP